MIKNWNFSWALGSGHLREPKEDVFERRTRPQVRTGKMRRDLRDGPENLLRATSKRDSYLGANFSTNSAPKRRSWRFTAKPTFGSSWLVQKRAILAFADYRMDWFVSGFSRDKADDVSTFHSALNAFAWDGISSVTQVIQEDRARRHSIGATIAWVSFPLRLLSCERRIQRRPARNFPPPLFSPMKSMSRSRTLPFKRAHTPWSDISLFFLW